MGQQCAGGAPECSSNGGTCAASCPTGTTACGSVCINSTSTSTCCYNATASQAGVLLNGICEAPTRCLLTYNSVTLLGACMHTPRCLRHWLCWLCCMRA